MNTFIPKQLHLLQHWITERERIRVQHDARPQPPRPWTRDQTLHTYSFCNVRRMDDRVSRWLFRHWYILAAPAHTLLMQATLARLINEPRTLACYDAPMSWGTATEEWWEANLRQREGGELPVYTSAYLVTGTEYADGGKARIIPRIVGRVAQAAVPIITDTRSMQEMHEALMRVRGLGSFLAGQITADVRHLRGARHAPDRFLWAPLGPGSARGMARLLGRPVERLGMGQDAFQNTLLDLRSRLTLPTGVEGIDLQNCLCEFDKYSRVPEGRRPRRLYRVRDTAAVR